MLTKHMVDSIGRQLERDLQSEVAAERELALDRLGSLPTCDFQIIASRLDDPDPEVRATAAVNLGGLLDNRAWPLLINAAERESSDETLASMIHVLSDYTDPGVLEFLLRQRLD